MHHVLWEWVSAPVGNIRRLRVPLSWDGRIMFGDSHHVGLRRHAPLLPHYHRSWRPPKHTTETRHIVCQWQLRRLARPWPSADARVLCWMQPHVNPLTAGIQPRQPTRLLGADPLGRYGSPAPTMATVRLHTSRASQSVDYDGGQYSGKRTCGKPMSGAVAVPYPSAALFLGGHYSLKPLEGPRYPMMTASH